MIPNRKNSNEEKIKKKIFYKIILFIKFLLSKYIFYSQNFIEKIFLMKTNFLEKNTFEH